eukprot:m.8083 g.8083  ORF g.8083 m.8083 type:complete len:547 (+) comp3838_c0_seq1:1140-2780(+)
MAQPGEVLYGMGDAEEFEEDFDTNVPDDMYATVQKRPSRGSKQPQNTPSPAPVPSSETSSMPDDDTGDDSLPIADLLAKYKDDWFQADKGVFKHNDFLKTRDPGSFIVRNSELQGVYRVLTIKREDKNGSIDVGIMTSPQGQYYFGNSANPRYYKTVIGLVSDAIHLSAEMFGIQMITPPFKKKKGGVKRAFTKMFKPRKSSSRPPSPETSPKKGKDKEKKEKEPKKEKEKKSKLKISKSKSTGDVKPQKYDKRASSNSSLPMQPQNEDDEIMYENIDDGGDAPSVPPKQQPEEDTYGVIRTFEGPGVVTESKHAVADSAYEQVNFDDPPPPQANLEPEQYATLDTVRQAPEKEQFYTNLQDAPPPRVPKTQRPVSTANTMRPMSTHTPKQETQRPMSVASMPMNVGRVPTLKKSFVELGKIRDLESYWFYPDAGREQADHILGSKPVGAFIIRKSNKPNYYALTVKKTDGSLWNGLILLKDDLYWMRGREEPFDDLATVVYECRGNKALCEKFGLPVDLVLPHPTQAYKFRGPSNTSTNDEDLDC